MIRGTSDLLLLWNHSEIDAGQTPLTAAISQNGGESWLHVRDLEDDPEHGFAYPSITFVGEEVLVTYYRTRFSLKWGGMGWELKLKILPHSWFYESDDAATAVWQRAAPRL